MLNLSHFEIITKDDKRFPQKLHDLKDCPQRLFAIGNISLLNNFSIAIVGARRCLEESEGIAQELSRDLSKFGITIVSGFAKGIDSTAHRSAIKEIGKTIAVLSGGFEKIYPKENMELLEKILENDGLVITEHPPETPWLRAYFLERNRIIAGLSERDCCYTSWRKKWIFSNSWLWDETK